MSTAMSLRAYAKHRGVSDASIRKRVGLGYLDPALRDGGIDCVMADQIIRDRNAVNAEAAELRDLARLARTLGREAYDAKMERWAFENGVELRDDGLRKCKGCGELFEVPPGATHRTYCSLQCLGKHRYADVMESRMTPCAHCGSVFENKVAVARRLKYCSKECRNIAAHPQRLPLGTCERCGGDIIPGKKNRNPHRRFCSLRCANTKPPFIGPPYIWIPRSARMDYSVLPTLPSPKVSLYYSKTEVCPNGHISPRRYHKGRWECVACNNLARRA